MEMDLLMKNKLIILGVAIGAAGGFFYYYFIGCNSGSCGITSDPLNSTLYGAAIGGLLFNVFKIKNNNTINMELENIIKNNQGTIIDVRTPGEFGGGNVAGSKNIPLNEIPMRINEIKSMKAPLVLCCASGGRSAQATQIISKEGIECYNAGSWLDVDYYKTKEN